METVNWTLVLVVAILVCAFLAGYVVHVLAYVIRRQVEQSREGNKVVLSLAERAQTASLAHSMQEGDNRAAAPDGPSLVDITTQQPLRMAN